MTSPSIEIKRKTWDSIIANPDLAILRFKNGLGEATEDIALRSLYWRLFLEYFPNTKTAQDWRTTIISSRKEYENLKEKFIIDPSKVQSEDISLHNPLNPNENNPWNQKFKDMELEALIKQDVERTFPELSMFREKNVQRLLTSILLTWCKINPDISYRQGMHELLAVLYLVVLKDAIDSQTSESEFDELFYDVFDASFVEHDSALLFFRIMKSLKSWYEIGNADLKNSSKEKVLPIILSCRKIQNDYLARIDPDLHRHLELLGIEPQIYGIRWLRLLFSREFEMDELLSLWDAIFAFDPNFDLVEWVSVSMLLSLRIELLSFSDSSKSLQRLMRFPPLERLGITISDLVKSAINVKREYLDHQVSASISKEKSIGLTRVPSKKRTMNPWKSNFESEIQTSKSSDSEIEFLRRQLKNLYHQQSKIKNRDEAIRATLMSLFNDMQQSQRDPLLTEPLALKLESWSERIKVLSDGLGPHPSEEAYLTPTEINQMTPMDEITTDASTTPKLDWSLKGLGIQTSASKSRPKSPIDTLIMDSNQSSSIPNSDMVGVLRSSFEGINKAFQGLMNDSSSQAHAPLKKSNYLMDSDTKPSFPAQIYDLNISMKNGVSSKSSSHFKKSENFEDPLGAT